MSSGSVVCEKCGDLSQWAAARLSQGESPICYTCQDRKESQEEPECTCSNRDLFHFGCQCAYSKHIKKGKRTCEC